MFSRRLRTTCVPPIPCICGHSCRHIRFAIKPCPDKLPFTLKHLSCHSATSHVSPLTSHLSSRPALFGVQNVLPTCSSRHPVGMKRPSAPHQCCHGRVNFPHMEREDGRSWGEGSGVTSDAHGLDCVECILTFRSPSPTIPASEPPGRNKFNSLHHPRATVCPWVGWGAGACSGWKNKQEGGVRRWLVNRVDSWKLPNGTSQVNPQNQNSPCSPSCIALGRQFHDTNTNSTAMMRIAHRLASPSVCTPGAGTRARFQCLPAASNMSPR